MALTQPTSVRLPHELRQLVKAEAKRTGQPQQRILQSAIRAGLSMFVKSKGAK